MVGAMTEAVLFRKAKERTFCIDENEKTNAQGNENLKLLLNSAYKKGLVVERMTKRKSNEGEKQVVEEFEVYCPIAMANIWGMDSILSDRCLTTILEKSSIKKITRLIENFENNEELKIIKGGLIRLTENIGDDLDYFGDAINDWNIHVEQEGKKPRESKYDKLFKKIDTTEIESRDLELFFPLFIIADICGEEILNKITEFSKEMVRQKRQQDLETNIDVQIYELVSKYPNSEFIGVSDLVKRLRESLEYGEHKEGWLNNKFFGRALRRLNLVLADRHGSKREVRLDVEKAKEKIKLFKPVEQINNSELDKVFSEK